MSTFDLFRHDFVLSIRPEYATKIMSGEKKVELRRRFPSGTVTGAVAYIYATAPVQSILGWATIVDVKTLPIEEIWKRYESVAGIRQSDFDAYYRGTETGCVLELSGVVVLAEPIGLEDLRSHFSFVPPQSYCYADDSYRRIIQHA